MGHGIVAAIVMSSMIVDEFDIVGVAVAPNEANSPLVIHAN